MTWCKIFIRMRSYRYPEKDLTNAGELFVTMKDKINVLLENAVERTRISET